MVIGCVAGPIGEQTICGSITDRSDEIDIEQARDLVNAASPTMDREVTPNCFIVGDANGRALSYVHYENEPGPAIGGQVANA